MKKKSTYKETMLKARYYLLSLYSNFRKNKTPLDCHHDYTIHCTVEKKNTTD